MSAERTFDYGRVVGYRGKLEEQDEARRMRAEGRTLADIASALGVSKSSVSLWVRDVEFTPSTRRYGPQRRPHPFHEAKLREIEELDADGRQRIGMLSDDAYLAAGIALYAGEGSKTEGAVMFANSDPAMIDFFCRWFRQFFDVDERRLRVRVYLHEGLDLAAAQAFWADLTGVPLDQFIQPYRAPADQSRRRNKHQHGCAYVSYSCTRTHRAVMGLVRALLSTDAIPG